MRTCKKCGIIKPLEAFPPQGNGGEYRRHECRECLLKRYNRYYKADKATYSEKGKRNYQSRKARGYYADPENRARIAIGHKKVATKLRKQALNHYGAECACCGETIERFLTIDHTNNDGKEMRKTHFSGTHFYRWLRDNKYPDSCRVLCFNCNIGRAMNKGICPHKEGSTTIPKGSRVKRPEARHTHQG